MNPVTVSPPLQGSSLALLTDLYQLTMACAYWKSGTADKEAVFHLSFRQAPFHGGFTIAAGLAAAIEYVRDFHFEESDLAYLATVLGRDQQPLFEPAFLAKCERQSGDEIILIFGIR